MPTWQRAYPKHKPFKCCAAWHLRKSGLYLAIYDLLGGLTAGGESDFFSSINHVAKYFETDYETTRRVFTNLRKMGWLKYDDAGKLWYVPHDAWAQEHPDKCNTRELLPWQVETDPLVGALFAASSGKLRIRENQIKGVRKHGSDDEILKLFTTELAAAADKQARGSWNGTSPGACFLRVCHFLKARSARTSSKTVVENTGYSQG
jgi:hypothetical protein